MVGGVVGGNVGNAQVGGVIAKNAMENNALDISSTDTFGKNRGGKKEEKPEATVFQKILQAIMPAHVAGVTKNKEDKDALMAIASLRNNVTGPIVLTGILATYGGSTLVQLTPAVAKSLFNFCSGNPITCNNAGIVVTEMGAGVSLGNPATAVRGAAGKVVQNGAKVAGEVAKEGKKAIENSKPLLNKLSDINREQLSRAGSHSAHEAVQNRINIANTGTEFTPLRDNGVPVSAGFQHVLDGHFNRPIANKRSIFSISPEELKGILSSKAVVSSPVKEIPGGQFERIVNTGKIIGTTSINEGGLSTTYIKIFTDRAGNLITTYPVKVK